MKMGKLLLMVAIFYAVVWVFWKERNGKMFGIPCLRTRAYQFGLQLCTAMGIYKEFEGVCYYEKELVGYR